jgi:hypothetical protein
VGLVQIVFFNVIAHFALDPLSCVDTYALKGREFAHLYLNDSHRAIYEEDEG